MIVFCLIDNGSIVKVNPVVIAKHAEQYDHRRRDVESDFKIVEKRFSLRVLRFLPTGKVEKSSWQSSGISLFRAELTITLYLTTSKLNRREKSSVYGFT